MLRAPYGNMGDFQAPGAEVVLVAEWIKWKREPEWRIMQGKPFPAFGQRQICNSRKSR